MRVLVVGAGIFGVQTSYSLAQRGVDATLVDPGPVPHPLAASTDISKVVRLEYGADEAYAAWMEAALDGFRRWNRELGDPLFHETGVLFMSGAPLAQGGFEADSLATLNARGHAVQRLDAAAIAARFPAWAASRGTLPADAGGTQAGAGMPEAIWDAEGGWVESGRLLAALAARARGAGVRHVAARATALLERGSRVVGIATEAGDLEADEVVLATGAWTSDLVPELRSALRAVAQPVFHLTPADPARFEAAHFPVFGADIATSGWYGFPLHPRERVVKIAHHGAGRELHPESQQRAQGPTPADHARLAAFLAHSCPALAAAPVTYTRLCLYSDSPDGHLWIARHPARPGLTVAAGDSGHAFKFAPLVGDWIADVALQSAPGIERFRWRPELSHASATPTGDAARSSR